MATAITKTDHDQVHTKVVVRKCAPCSKTGTNTLASFHCKTCSQYQCSECVKVHKEFDFMSGHSIKTIQTLSCPSQTTNNDGGTALVADTGELALLGMSELNICDKHDKVFEIFCSNHGALCCSVCAVEWHLTCSDVNGIPKHVEKSAFNPQNIGTKIRATCKIANALIRNSEKACTDLESKINKIDEVFDLVRENIIARFSQIKSKSLPEAVTYMMKLSDDLKTKEAIFSQIIQNFDSLCMQYRAILLHGSVAQAFVGYMGLGNKYKMFHLETEEGSSELYVVDCCLPNSHVLNRFKTEKETFVKIDMEMVKGDKCVSEPIMPLRYSSIGWTAFEESENRKCEAYLVGIDFLPDGRLAAVDRKNKACMLLDNELKQLATCPLEYDPNDVACMPDTRIAVACYGIFSSDSIVILDVDSGNNLSVIKKLKLYEMYDSICFFDEQTLIAGSEVKKCPAEKVNIQAVSRSEFSVKLPSKNFKYGCRTATVEYIRRHDILVFAEIYEHKVTLCYVNEPNQDSIVVKHDYMKEPKGMCIGPYDCIFVCGYKSHNIIHISPRGRIVCFYTLAGLYWPIDISISRDGTKMVVSTAQKGVHLHVITISDMYNKSLEIESFEECHITVL